MTSFVNWSGADTARAFWWRVAETRHLAPVADVIPPPALAVLMCHALYATSSTICGKSWLVAATSRTFTRIVRVPPTRSNACSCSTRSTMGYTWNPPWARAASKQPRRSTDGGRRAREEATGSSAAQKTLAKLKGRLDSKELLPPEVREAGDLTEQARIMTIRLDQALFAIREPQAGDIGERVDMLSEERRRCEFEAYQDPNAMHDQGGIL
jgi:hypothetical protein